MKEMNTEFIEEDMVVYMRPEGDEQKVYCRRHGV